MLSRDHARDSKANGALGSLSVSFGLCCMQKCFDYVDVLNGKRHRERNISYTFKSSKQSIV